MTTQQWFEGISDKICLFRQRVPGSLIELARRFEPLLRKVVIQFLNNKEYTMVPSHLHYAARSELTRLFKIVDIERSDEEIVNDLEIQIIDSLKILAEQEKYLQQVLFIDPGDADYERLKDILKVFLTSSEMPVQPKNPEVRPLFHFRVEVLHILLMLREIREVFESADALMMPALLMTPSIFLEQFNTEMTPVFDRLLTLSEDKHVQRGLSFWKNHISHHILPRLENVKELDSKTGSFKKVVDIPKTARVYIPLSPEMQLELGDPESMVHFRKLTIQMVEMFENINYAIRKLPNTILMGNMDAATLKAEEEYLQASLNQWIYRQSSPSPSTNPMQFSELLKIWKESIVSVLDDAQKFEREGLIR